jgi:hypothetical protein
MSEERPGGDYIDGRWYTNDELVQMGLRSPDGPDGIDPDYAENPSAHGGDTSARGGGEAGPGQTSAQAHEAQVRAEEWLEEAKRAGKTGEDLAYFERLVNGEAVSWDRQMREGLGGMSYDISDLDGVMRNSADSGDDPANAIRDAIARNVQQGQSGGDRAKGGYDTNWNDEDPSRLGGGDAPAGYTREMERLEAQLNVPGITPAQRNDIRMKQAAMFNGAYPSTPAPVSTLGAITNTAENPSQTQPAAASPMATSTPSAPVQPYSARATTAPSAPSTVASQVPTTGMPAAPVRTMGNMLGPAQPQNPYALENAWNTTSANYRQAGDAYAAQRGGNYNPAPWSGTRMGAPRNALGAPTTVGSPNDVALDTDANERRRAYRFGVRNAQANQENAAMGQQDFNGQMDNWLRAYNEWNKKGVDPLAIPGGVV